MHEIRRSPRRRRNHPDIGGAISLLRVAHGMSARQVAAAMSTSRSYVTAVEMGYRLPTLPQLERFARALGVTVYQLITLATLETPS